MLATHGINAAEYEALIEWASVWDPEVAEDHSEGPMGAILEKLWRAEQW
jgi:hypothetical protein